MVLQEHISLGVYPPPPEGKPEDESLKLMTDVLLKAGMRAEQESDIVAQRWRKVLWWVPGSLLRPGHALTSYETQECSVFKLVHAFAGQSEGAPGRVTR